jgi:DNA-binding LacI/PurR family transcriptional regulator
MSIQRIAKLANVPYSTTWRAINRVPGVSADAAKAVRKAMEQIGYVGPTERPRNGVDGAGRRHQQVAMLYFREKTALSLSILRAVQKILLSEKMNLIFGHVTGPEDLPPAVRSGQVDGILGYGEFPDSAVTPQLREMPAVWMMSPTGEREDAWGDRIMVDHRMIGQLAARYLLEKGRRHLAFLNPAPTFPFMCERGMGFRAAAEGGPETIQFVSPDVNLEPNGREAMDQMMQRWAALSPRPTGIFVPTDVVAIGVYHRLAELGVRAGRDVEVISCDRQEEQLSHLDPPPVSIDLNREMIARLAVERLLWRMREGMQASPVRIVVSPVLEGYSA